MALKKYSQMKMGKIERIEGIEPLRAIENNLNLGTFVIKGSDFAVELIEIFVKFFYTFMCFHIIYL